jgi:Raf kinase inhibitor-like YbhB/YbcL family protein
MTPHSLRLRGVVAWADGFDKSGRFLVNSVKRNNIRYSEVKTDTRSAGRLPYPPPFHGAGHSSGSGPLAGAASMGSGVNGLVMKERDMKCWTISIIGSLGLAVGGVHAQGFSLLSTDFKPGESLPSRAVANVLGCKGDNLSPALRWENPPAGTRSFALMVHDPDAVTGGAGIWHWVVLNIPATATALEQGAGTADGSRLPPGSQQVANDYAGLTGSAGWGGPCPPVGHQPHHYNFTLYALKVEQIKLPPSATASQAGFVVNLNAIGQARLSATYGRAP